VHLYRFAIELEPAHLLNGLQRSLFTVKDDESLALALQAALSNDVEDGAVVLKDFGKSLLHRIDLDALLKIVHLYLSACATGRNVGAWCALQSLT
jgi:hypothetical protein|tara:strand:- start:23617 stop:23901 length:285 start_codon:yes stop_codon:yes gene_type:complete